MPHQLDPHSIAETQAQLSMLRKQFDAAGTEEEREDIAAQIAEVNRLHAERVGIYHPPNFISRLIPLALVCILVVTLILVIKNASDLATLTKRNQTFLVHELRHSCSTVGNVRARQSNARIPLEQFELNAAVKAVRLSGAHYDPSDVAALRRAIKPVPIVDCLSLYRLPN